MAAPQQSMIPTYKETANIPRPRTVYERFDARDEPAAALARLLGVVPDAVTTYQDKQTEDPTGEIEREQLRALSMMGAEQSRLRVAKGDSLFGLMKSKEMTLDAYEAERGRVDADLMAGQLRDAYAAAGLHENPSPDAFKAFVAQQQGAMWEKLKDVNPSYYHGFITRIAPIYEEMAKVHVGNLDSFLPSVHKQALENRLQSQIDINLTSYRENDSLKGFFGNLMQAESGGNYNAFHNNARNNSIRFTEMTIADVLNWQRSGSWKRHGASSSAVGFYQFMPDTLERVVRAAGLDPKTTRFTPAVQDKLAYVLLEVANPKYSLSKFLAGEISAEDFAEHTLATQWAALKGKSGSGKYDGVGNNKASVSFRKVVNAALGLKQAFLAGQIKAPTKSADGKLILNADDASDTTLGGFLDTTDAEFGVNPPEARSMTADALIKRMESDPTFADDARLEDLMSDAKLPTKDRERVREARDRIRQETSQKQQMAEEREVNEVVELARRAITGNPDDLQELRNRNPKVYQKVLTRISSADPEHLDNEGFLEDVNYDNPQFPQVAMKAFIDGDIDKSTFAEVMETYETRKTAAPILRLAGVKETVDTLRRGLPTDGLKKTFDAQLALAIVDLMKANGGNRPSVSEINATAQQIQQQIAALHQQDAQSRISRPEYQL